MNSFEGYIWGSLHRLQSAVSPLYMAPEVRCLSVVNFIEYKEKSKFSIFCVHFSTEKRFKY